MPWNIANAITLTGIQEKLMPGLEAWIRNANVKKSK